MIKKAVLLLLTAPFLMVFSDYVFAAKVHSTLVFQTDKKTSASSCSSSGHRPHFDTDTLYYWLEYNTWGENPTYSNCYRRLVYKKDARGENPLDWTDQTVYGHTYSDEECQEKAGGSSVPISPSSANYLSNGGSYSTAGGSCSVTGAGGVMACSGDPVKCVMDLKATSTGETAETLETIDLSSSDSDGTFSVTDFSTPDYLNEVPGGCSDASSCVAIGDKNYLVDWDSAPDYFEYVDSNGNTHSKSSSGGGGSGGDTGGGDTGGDGDPTDPTDPTDPGGDNSGGDDSGNDDSDDNNGGGSSGGGGSTVPDFEFDESGIIEAIGSAGQSNQGAINALSNDVTGAISDQTTDLNTATDAQTETLTNALEGQSDAISDDLDSLGDTITTGVDDAIGKQTEEVSGLFEGLGKSLTGALGLAACYPDDGPTEEGHSAATDDKGLLGCIQQIGRGMVTNLVNRLTNPDDMPGDSETGGMVDGEGVADDVMESLEQGADQQNTAIYDEFEGIFEGGGIIDGALEPLRDFVTSFLPSLPTGGCTPLTFGAGERSFTIDCEGFNLLKAALSWVLFFFTAYQLISIPMDARKSQ